MQKGILGFPAVFYIFFSPLTTWASPEIFGALPKIRSIAISPDGNRIATLQLEHGRNVLAETTGLS